MSASIEQRVISIIRKVIDDQPVRPPTDEIALTACLADDLGCDFLDINDIIMACETEFNIELHDDPLRCDTTVADLIRLVKGALREKTEVNR